MWHFSNSFRPSSKYQHLTIMTSFPSLLVGNQRSRLSFPVWLGTIRLSRHYPCALFSAFIFLTSFGCNFIHYIMTLFSVFSVSSGLLPHVILAVQYWVFDFESCSFISFLPCHCGPMETWPLQSFSTLPKLVFSLEILAHSFADLLKFTFDLMERSVTPCIQWKQCGCVSVCAAVLIHSCVECRPLFRFSFSQLRLVPSQSFSNFLGQWSVGRNLMLVGSSQSS